MRIISLIVFIFLFFQGCSFKSPENTWEYNSASSFSSYTKNFLSANDDIAQDDLQRAMKYAKQSANLEQLSRIYLGECALNLSIGEKDNCSKYKSIEELVDSSELNAYYLMLENQLKKEQIKNLSEQYQVFMKYKSSKEYNKAFDSIKKMKQASSKFIAASLIKNKLDKKEVNYLINEASFYGYKKLVLFWLKHLVTLEENPHEKEKIIKKIKILSTL